MDYKDYSWLEKASNVSEIAALHEEYSKLPMSSVGDDRGSVGVVATQGIKKEWERELSDALFRVTGFSQFFGSLAFQCKYKWSLDLDTAGAVVIGDKFYVLMNPIFMFNFLKKGEYHSFTIVHEVNHIFFEHGDRCKEAGYDHILFNEACDYFIHCKMDDMVKANRTAVANLELLPKELFEICFDRKYDGMTEDEIYRDLEKNAKKQKSDQSADDGKGKAFDRPVETQQDSSGTSTATKQAVASAVRAAATQAQRSNSVGNAELGIIRRFLEMTEPTVSWRDQLADFFEKTRDDRPTYSKYSRRSSDEVVFPSKEGERIRVGFGIDTSGSMSQNELTEAASELQGLLDQIGTWEVDVATADTKAYKVCSMSSDEEDDLGDLDLPGFGGTRMSAMVELFQDEWGDDEYNVMIIVTDGRLEHGDILNVYEHEVPLIVVVTSDGEVPQWLAEEVTVIQIND